MVIAHHASMYKHAHMAAQVLRLQLPMVWPHLGTVLR
jgi:hypothetical protein